jgi:hypothetical protein
MPGVAEERQQAAVEYRRRAYQPHVGEHPEMAPPPPRAHRQVDWGGPRPALGVVGRGASGEALP